MDYATRKEVSNAIRSRIRCHSKQQEFAKDRYDAGVINREEWLRIHNEYTLRILELQNFYQQIS